MAFENRLTLLIARQFTYQRLLLCTLLVFGLFSYSLNTVASESKSTIVWQTVHTPRASIKSGPLEGEGFIQLILEQITDEMPEYYHEYAITTVARTTVDLKAGKNVCPPSLLATKERKAWAVFSHSNIF